MKNVTSLPDHTPDRQVSLTDVKTDHNNFFFFIRTKNKLNGNTDCDDTLPRSCIRNEKRIKQQYQP